MGLTVLRIAHIGVGIVKFYFEDRHLYTEFPISRSYCYDLPCPTQRIAAGSRVTFFRWSVLCWTAAGTSGSKQKDMCVYYYYYYYYYYYHYYYYHRHNHYRRHEVT